MEGAMLNVGEVLTIQGYNNETSRSMAVVRWTSGFVEAYRLGHDGRVDLTCIRDAFGGHCYKHHLPILGKDCLLPYTMAAQLGLRVIREENGCVGTVTEVRVDPTTAPPVCSSVTIQWDNTRASKQFRPESALLQHVRVLDNAPTGVIHFNVTCKCCHRIGFSGFRWTCSQCVHFDLCSVCYMEDQHELHHTFRRYETPSSPGVEVPQRLGSERLETRGIFPGAQVVLWADDRADSHQAMRAAGSSFLGGYEEEGESYAQLNRTPSDKGLTRNSSSSSMTTHSIPKSPKSPPFNSERAPYNLSTNDDESPPSAVRQNVVQRQQQPQLASPRRHFLTLDGENFIGQVVAIQGFQKETERSTAFVAWPNGVTKAYTVGHKGSVQLRCIQHSYGGSYYRDHLPLLGSFSPSNGSPISLGLRVVAIGSKGSPLDESVEGNTGTVVGLHEEPGKATPTWINIQWDCGKRERYATSSLVASGMRVFDTAPAGIYIHEVTCKGCHELNISGFRWQCEACGDYDLCSRCYMGDKHSLSHRFVRYENSKAHGAKMSKRIYSVKIEARGMFVGAKVIRSDDPKSVGGGDDFAVVPGESEELHDRPSSSSSSRHADLIEDVRRLHVTERERRRPSPNRFEESSVGELLVQMSSEGNLDQVRDILRYFPDKVNYLSKQTALQASCLLGHVPMTLLLLSSNAHIEVQDDYGYTALHCAVFQSNLEVMEILLRAGANTEAVDRHLNTALHVAAIKQNASCVHLLIQYKCNVNAQNADGNTALHLAIESDNGGEIVDLLLAEAATLCALRNNSGHNVFRCALLKEDGRLTRRVYERAQVRAEPRMDWRNVVVYATHVNENVVEGDEGGVGGGESYDEEDGGSGTLIRAVRRGDLASVDRLVSQGSVDVNATDRRGNTALHVALAKYVLRCPPPHLSRGEAPFICQVFEECSAVIRDGVGDNWFVALSCFLALSGSHLAQRNVNGVAPLDLVISAGLLTLLEHYAEMSYSRAPG